MKRRILCALLTITFVLGVAATTYANMGGGRPYPASESRLILQIPENTQP